MQSAFARISLEKFFTAFITSKEVGTSKPSPEFFNGILNMLGTAPNKAIMIGNDYIKDIEGAKNAGIKTIYITNEKGDFYNADYLITSFGELLSILSLT